LYGLVNFGQAALNSMRIEHGYKLWGRELTLDTNPFECGLGHLVDFEKKEFIGRSSLLELSKKQYTRKLVLLALDWRASSDGIEDLRKIPQGNEVVRREGSEERIGQITSGAYSVRLQRPMAFAWINSDISSSETINVDLGFDRINAKILDQPPAQEIS